MNIIIDATWIGDMYNKGVMHGAYRVTEEYLKRLGNFQQHNFYLTNTNYISSKIDNIQQFINVEVKGKNVSVLARHIKLLEHESGVNIFRKISNYIPIPHIYPFIDSAALSKMNVFHSPADTIPAIIRRRKNIKKYFTAHDLLPIVRPDLSTNFLDYTKRLYDSLTTEMNILAVSENTKKDILFYRKDINPEKIRVTYLGANKKLFYTNNDPLFMMDRMEKMSLKGKKYFLTVNSMARYKNVDFIVENFIRLIAEKNIQDLFLVIVGQNREKNYKEYVNQEYGLSEKILMFDYISDDDLVVIYNHSLAFLYLSLYEGFGLPVLEAMQSGTPVICSNAASLPEVVGSAAVLVDPADDLGFVQSMEQLYDSDSVRQSLIEKGLKQAEKFSWEKHARDVVSAYEDM